MMVAQYESYGAAREVLRVVEAPVPSPASTELLIRVHASSVNPIDCSLRSGYGRELFESRRPVKLPVRPGRDVAGEVVSVGADVKGFTPGDQVYAVAFYGANGQYLSVPAGNAALKPKSLNYHDAAALPFAAATAWTALIKAAGLNEKTTNGKRVLIPRGAGGVGNIGIQLIKAWGGYVATLCSTRNVDLVRSLGADLIIDYKTQDRRELPHDFDIAFDTAFDTEQLLLDALKVHSGAVYASVVTPRVKFIDQFGLAEGLRRAEQFLAERVAAQRALGRSYHWIFADMDGEALRVVAQLVDAGKIRPIVDRIYPLENIAEAHERCESGESQGRVIVDLDAAGTAA